MCDHENILHEQLNQQKRPVESQTFFAVCQLMEFRGNKMKNKKYLK